MFEMLVRVTGFFFLFNVKLNKNSSSDIVGHNYDLTIPLIAFHLHWEEHFLMFAEWKLLHPSLPEICKGFKKRERLGNNNNFLLIASRLWVDMFLVWDIEVVLLIILCW